MKNPLCRLFTLSLLAGGLLAFPAALPAESASTNSPAETKAKPAADKFYGPVSKVDADKHTFTVGDQTFTVGTDTQMTTGDGQKATLANAVVGQPARGSYTKANDGTLNVTKVRFGKKVGGKGSSEKGKKGGKKKDSSSSESQSQ
jgi:hypothetical protein